MSHRQEAVLLRFLGSHCKFSDVVKSCDKLLDSELPLFDARSPSSLSSSPATPLQSRMRPERSRSRPTSAIFLSTSLPSLITSAAALSSLTATDSSSPGDALPSPLQQSLSLDTHERVSEGQRRRTTLFGTFSRGKGKGKLREMADFDDEATGSAVMADPEQNKMQVQAGLKSFFDDFRQLLTPAFVSLSDVCFVVEGKAFHVHKLMLVARSSYFRTFFRYEAGSGPFDFNWLSAQTFQQVTEFLYTGMVGNLLLEHAGPLLVAADMLNLEGLIDICELMLSTWVSNVENPVEVMELLQDSGDFGARQLRTACIERLGACYSQISETPEYSALDSEMKKQILAARKSRYQLSSSSSSTRSTSPPSSFFVQSDSSPSLSSSSLSVATGHFTTRRSTY